MGIFKNIFGTPTSKTKSIETDENGIGIKGIYPKASGETEVDFVVPSNKGYCLSTEVDDFTKEKKIKFIQTASYVLDKIMIWADGDDLIMFNIGLRKEGNKDLISFATYQKSLKFKQADKVAFLFKNEDIREFELMEDGYRIDKEPEGVIIESTALLTSEDLSKFSSVKVKKWRHIPNDEKRKPVTGSLSHELQTDILEMTRVYQYLLENQTK